MRRKPLQTSLVVLICAHSTGATILLLSAAERMRLSQGTAEALSAVHGFTSSPSDAMITSRANQVQYHSVIYTVLFTSDCLHTGERETG
ncbi:hypothetical protein FD754_001982 [Muntiacus muntjak]|uniref:Uncharacterized protein n=1 Tax=Muntiacus muntjak TaxID=9888 RepID=A0A5N3WBW1_MUNMU|nr:hypothetical protein FD754_001982 [Muntiacus muntjak]